VAAVTCSGKRDARNQRAQEPPAQSSLDLRPAAAEQNLTLDRAPADPAIRPVPGTTRQESQMPKLKTKSGAKKRFKVTATGKVLFAQSGKRHGMIKRTNKQIRDHRGTAVMFKTDGDRIRQYWLPND
jgi:large subunit ribosomal protein L35